MKRFIEKYFNLLTVLFIILLVLGFLCVRIFADSEQGENGPGAEPAAPAQESLLPENINLSQDSAGGAVHARRDSEEGPARRSSAHR